jgi:hypothetical protein
LSSRKRLLYPKGDIENQDDENGFKSEKSIKPMTSGVSQRAPGQSGYRNGCQDKSDDLENGNGFHFFLQADLQTSKG